jgi:hypothetical protein
MEKIKKEKEGQGKRQNYPYVKSPYPFVHRPRSHTHTKSHHKQPVVRGLPLPSVGVLPFQRSTMQLAPPSLCPSCRSPLPPYGHPAGRPLPSRLPIIVRQRRRPIARVRVSTAAVAAPQWPLQSGGPSVGNIVTPQVFNYLA